MERVNKGIKEGSGNEVRIKLIWFFVFKFYYLVTPASDITLNVKDVATDYRDETERLTRLFKWRTGTYKDHDTSPDLQWTENRTEMSCKVSPAFLVHDLWGEFY